MYEYMFFSDYIPRVKEKDRKKYEYRISYLNIVHNIFVFIMFLCLFYCINKIATFKNASAIR